MISSIHLRVCVTAIGIAVWLLCTVEPAQAIQWQCGSKPIEPCFTHHGRLSSQNGIGLKIWLIGTRRVVGLENSSDSLPPEILKYLDMASPNHSYIYGDFNICPLEPDRPGHLRLVCVNGARRLVVQNLRTSRPPFRLLSTWPGDGRSGR
jgi:hypothetical protein